MNCWVNKEIFFNTWLGAVEGLLVKGLREGEREGERVMGWREGKVDGDKVAVGSLEGCDVSSVGATVGE